MYVCITTLSLNSTPPYSTLGLHSNLASSVLCGHPIVAWWYHNFDLVAYYSKRYWFLMLSWWSLIMNTKHVNIFYAMEETRIHYIRYIVFLVLKLSVCLCFSPPTHSSYNPHADTQRDIYTNLVFMNHIHYIHCNFEH